MAGIEKRSIDSPDEVRSPDKVRIDVLRINEATVARAVYEPGWRWSECIKPVVGGDSCQVDHFGVITSGRIGVRADDGTELELAAGDVYHVPPGHDAWIVGDEQAVAWEFSSAAAASFGKPS